METKYEVLFIGADSPEAQGIIDAINGIRKVAIRLTHVTCLANALALFTDKTFNVLLLDLNLPDSRGLKTYNKVHERAGEALTIILCGEQDEETAFRAMRAGAEDYCLREQFTGDIFVRSIRYAEENRLARTNLRQQENLLRNLLNATHDANVFTDIKGRVIDFNPAAFRLFEFPQGKDPKGYNFAEFIAEDVREQTVTDYRQMVSERTGRSLTVPLITFRKRPFYAEITSNTVTDSDNQTIGAISLIRDITENKKMAEDLKASEQRLKILFDYAPEPYYLIDTTGNFIDCNKEAEKLLGYAKEELVGKNLLSFHLVPLHELPKILSHLTEIMKGHPTGPEQVVIKNRKKVELIIEARTYPVRINEQSLILVTARDITQQHKAQQTIILEKERAQSYLDIAGVMIISIDPDGSIRMINKKGCEILGMKQSAITGKNWFDHFIPEKSREQVRMIYGNLMKGQLKGFEYAENEIVAADGTHKLISWQNSVIRDEWDKITGILSSGLDITQQKKAEEALIDEKNLSDIIINTLPGIFFIYDIHNRIIRWNENLESVTEYSSAELQQLKVGDFIIENTGKPLNAWHLNWLPVGRTSYESEVFTRTGKRIPYYFFGQDLYINNQIFYIEVGVDITDQKLAMQHLKESEERLKILFDYAPDAYLLLDAKGSIIEANKVVENITGYKREEMISKNIFKLHIFNAEQINTVSDILTKNSMGIPVDKQEFMIKREDGVRLIVETRSYPVRIHDQILSLLTIRDITEINKAQEALARSEYFNRRLIESSPVGLMYLDREGVITYENPMMQKMMGRSPGMVSPAIGRKIYDVDAIKKSGLVRFVKKMIKGDMVASKEVFYTSIAGVKLYLEVNTAPLYDEHDNIEGIILMVINITQRKKAEMEIKKLNEQLEKRVKQRTLELENAYASLKSSEKKYRELADLLPQTVFEINHSGTFTYVNQHFLTSNGCSRQDIKKGLTIYDLVGAGKRSQLRRFFEATTTEKDCPPGEFVFFKKDGTTYPVIIYVAPIESARQREAGIRGVVMDITDIKQVQEQLRLAREEAETANKAKSAFLANMSHEIRTPMNAILGFTELLLNSVADEGHRKYLETIRSSGKTLLNIINDILDLSKIEAGKLEFQPETTNPFTLVKEVQQLLAAKYNDKMLEFIVNISSDVPDRIKIDGTRMRQVLINILDNAFKFTNEGFVKIAVTATGEDVNHKGSSPTYIDLLFEIEDSGIGIPRKFREAIFEPFEQIDIPYKNKPLGTGLGLTITRKLVDMMHGEIIVTSQLNKGSKFTVVLPHIEVSKGETKTGKEQPIPDGSLIHFDHGTILIVDDVEDDRSYLTSVLKDTGLRIVEAANGLDAWQLTKEIHPDLILTDIRMPGIDGYELLRKIKSDPGLRGTHVVANTALAMKSDLETMDDASFDGTLIKPIHPDTLYNELIRHLPYTLIGQKIKRQPVSVQDHHEMPSIAERLHLIGLLEGEINEIWQGFKEQQPLEEVEEFGVRIKALAHQYHYSDLARYSDHLTDACKRFDVDDMLTILEKYPTLIANLKKVGK
jgi:PAS domain S-box-containing protein